jgi:ribosome maturation protein SDO1
VSLLRQILKKGEVQVGDKEREHDIAALRREIATLVAEKCVDPATHAPYSVSIIEKAMTEAGYSVRANKNAKSQVRGTWSRRLGPTSCNT